MEKIRYVYREKNKSASVGTGFPHFRESDARQVLHYHRSFPEYRETPLADLSALAGHLGVAGFYVKDESFRFGLNAFKVLGGSWCIGNYIAKRLGRPLEELTFDWLTAPETRKVLGPLTFVTATDGNHGRGIAWTAARLGQSSYVYMPRGSAQERLDNIRATGANASITDMLYDDVVRFAKTQAEKNGWVLVQDTAWPGYEEIPLWVMQGYMTMAYEAVRQLGETRPTHVFLQAGVGSMAAAVAAFLANYYGDTCPNITIVEPHGADCVYQTALHGDGALYPTQGDMQTIMAGLACGEVCSLAWTLLDACGDCFVTIPDTTAARGMRVLGNPLGGDPRVVSGESGASTTGLAVELLQNPSCSALREKLKLDEKSRILCFSTEGDTDRENYRRIVWNGAYPN